MVIVAGHVIVKPEERESTLTGGVGLVAQGRRAAGCLDVTIGADLIDPSRVNISERRESRAALDAHRGRAGPGDEQGAARRSASVTDYDVADARPSFEQDTP